MKKLLLISILFIVPLPAMIKSTKLSQASLSPLKVVASSPSASFCKLSKISSFLRSFPYMDPPRINKINKQNYKILLQQLKEPICTQKLADNLEYITNNKDLERLLSVSAKIKERFEFSHPWIPRRDSLGSSSFFWPGFIMHEGMLVQRAGICCFFVDYNKLEAKIMGADNNFYLIYAIIKEREARPPIHIESVQSNQ